MSVIFSGLLTSTRGSFASSVSIILSPSSLLFLMNISKSTRKEMRVVLQKAKELRQAELEERATAHAEAGNTSMESAIIE